MRAIWIFLLFFNISFFSHHLLQTSNFLLFSLRNPLLLLLSLHLPQLAQTSHLNHQAQYLKQQICSRHGGQLGIGVVRGGHLDDIGSDEIDPLQASQDGAQFARGPAAGFGRSGCRSNFKGEKGARTLDLKIEVGVDKKRKEGKGEKGFGGLGFLGKHTGGI